MRFLQYIFRKISNISPAFRNISTVFRQFLSIFRNISPFLARSRQYLASISPVSHQYLASISPVSRQYLTSISPVSRARPGFNPCVYMCRSWAGSCGGGFELIRDRKRDRPKISQFFTENHIKNNCSGVPGDPGLFLDPGDM